MTSIAHFRKSDGEVQTVEEHLASVQRLAEQYGSKLGVKHIAGLAAVLHDVGKYSTEFYNYIHTAMKNPEAPPKRGSVDHSTAGGKILFDLLHKNNDIYQTCLAEVVGNVIISHHSYLHDFISLDLTLPYIRRVQEKEIKDYEQIKESFYRYVISKESFQSYIEEARSELINFLTKDDDNNMAKKLMFLTKFIFSTLIDADRTNARQFEENDFQNDLPRTLELFSKYYDSLMQHIDNLATPENLKNPINQLRNKMSNQVEKIAKKPSDIYTLSIPTGGGKTLASLRYALKHANHHQDKERIIYVVPFTTIIEQNAAEVRTILNDEQNILEHHSNVVHEHLTSEDRDEQIDDNKALRLAKDNWDAPIVFTTLVQFLNTFYAYGSRNIRRLHNLSNSVIIFDEVQKVPTHCVSLFNHAVNFLKEYMNSSIVLCTATQPALDFVHHNLHIKKEAEMIEDIDAVVEAFKRVEIVDRASQEQFNQKKLENFIEDEMEEENSLLVILNTKQAVRDLYDSLKEKMPETQVYHLSTSMCPKHRMEILEKIREGLEKEENIVCISTQLIEAGVDISFDSVIRSLAGLDSIAQAAGRCNRHGNSDLKNVYVIDYIEENLRYLKEIAKGQKITKLILRDLAKNSNTHGGSLLSHQAMEFYFREFYQSFNSNLDYPIRNMNYSMLELLMSENHENSLLVDYAGKTGKEPELVIRNSYNTAAKNFEVIESLTTSILVPYGDGKEIIAKLNGNIIEEDLTSLFQHAQLYTVNIYKHQLNLLNESGNLTTLFNDQMYALKEGAYDDNYGLNIEGDSEQDFYFM